jgi:phosphoribosylamine--glycine ligase
LTVNILVIGSGGREHALAWKISQSTSVKKIYCAPGNAGIARIAECVSIDSADMSTLAEFAKSKSIDLTVVGPEQPLTLGIVDHFTQKGLKTFGPSKQAAELEGSKVFAKRFMKNHNIPTAGFGTFDASHQREAVAFIKRSNFPLVIKADGLAAGKGVVICETRDEAVRALDSMIGQRTFGAAGERIVIEEFLEGEEMSVFALTDGRDYRLLSPAQDHKRILDGDRGKNTGGMGAYAPAPAGTPQLMQEIDRTVVQPTIKGMDREGRSYKGCLYVGLMLTPSGPKVLEYNCRFGDPETQVVLPLIANDLVDLMLACVDGSMSKHSVEFRAANAVCIVMASAGYPDSYETGRPIAGLDGPFEDGVVVFHAGTKLERNSILSAGGRVLGVTAIGDNAELQQTIEKAYRAVGQIQFDGAYFRNDIGKKGVERSKRQHAEEVR